MSSMNEMINSQNINIMNSQLSRIHELEYQLTLAQERIKTLEKAINYALASHYGRLSPMNNAWHIVLENALQSPPSQE